MFGMISIYHFMSFHNNIYETNLARNDVFDFDVENILGYALKKFMERVYKLYFTNKFLNITSINRSQKSVDILTKNFSIHVITSRPF